MAAWIGGVILIGCIALTVVAGVTSIPLGPLQRLVVAPLNQRLAPFHIEARDITAQWKARGPSLMVQAEQISLANAENERIAFLPKGEAEFGLFALLGGDARIRSMSLGRPSIDVSRKASGVLAVGLGQQAPNGMREPLLQVRPMILAEVLSAQCGDNSAPRVVFHDGTLHFNDAPTETRLVFSDLEGTYDLADPERQLRLSASQMVGDQQIRFDIDVGCVPGKKVFNATISPNDAYPAVLSDVVPGLGFLRPFEIPVSGEISIRSRIDLSLEDIAFNLEGGAGSLELAEFGVANLGVTSAHLRGDLERQSGNLRINQAQIAFEQGRAVAGGAMRIEENGIAIELNAGLTGIAIGDLLPDWLVGLRSAMQGAAPDLVSNRQATQMKVEGLVRWDESGPKVSGTFSIWDGRPDPMQGQPPDAVVLEFEGNPQARVLSFWIPEQPL